MREETLRDFFLGRVSARELAADIEGSMVESGPGVTQHHIEDMHEEFHVEPDHLVRVCDAVLSGNLALESLEAIGFCLIASDAFEWDGNTEDGDRVAECTHHWSSPVINFPLVRDNVLEWRKLLLGQPAALEST